MASSGDELLGYVHTSVTAHLLYEHVSGKVKYINFQFQTSSTNMLKAICFSPQKAKPLTTAMQ